MDCTLQIISGPQAGTAFTLRPGPNVVGRGPKAQIQLTAPSISYEHALITLTREDCSLENLSSYGTLLNNEKVTGKVRLRSRDQIRLAPDVTLRVENAPGAESFNRRTLYVVILLSVLLTTLILVLNATWETSAPQANWDKAYYDLSAWIEKQVQAQRLPAKMEPLFTEAWRLEQAKDYQNSQKAWLKLQLLLDQSEEQTRILQTSAKYPQALARILANKTPDRIPSDAELDAAVVQFVKRRLDYAAKQGPKPRLGV